MADDENSTEEGKKHADPPRAPNLIVFPGGKRAGEGAAPNGSAITTPNQTQQYSPFELLLLAGKPPEKDADRLRRLADEYLGVFRHDGRGYVYLKERSLSECWPANSLKTEDVLYDLFDRETQRLATPGPVKAVWKYMVRRASKGPAGVAGRRWCAHAGCIYLDLCDPEGRYVEIDEHGWRLTSNPPVRFEKTDEMAPMPVPTRGGSVQLLQRYINVPDPGDFHLVVSFMVGCMVPGLPFAVLQVTGPHGSAKTESACFIMRLLDPQTEDPGGLPASEKEIFITVSKCYAILFDNASSMDQSQSNAICRVTTGGSHRARKFTTNGEQHIIPGHAPVIITAIDSVITASDLSSRTITIRLPKLTTRRPLGPLLKGFERDQPKILGALLDVLSHALRHRPTITVAGDHRLADFAVVATAAETHSHEVGSFDRVLERNRLRQNDDLLDHNPVIDMVVRFIRDRGRFEGTASALLEALTQAFRDEIGIRRTLPGGPHHLSRRLKAGESLLAANGIDLQQYRDSRTGIRMTSLKLESCITKEHGHDV